MFHTSRLHPGAVPPMIDRRLPDGSRRRTPRRPVLLESLEARTLMTGVPRYLTGPNPGTPLQIALGYLGGAGASVGYAAGDAARLKVTNQYADAHNGVTHVYLQQGFNGLVVENARLSVNVGPVGEVINVGGRFIAGLGNQPSAPKPPDPGLSALQALYAIADDLALTPSGPGTDGSPATGVDRSTTLTAPGISVKPVPAHLEYFATANGPRLAWDFVVTVSEPQFQVYNAFADANTGELLHAYEWVDHLSDGMYNVFPLPLGSPLDGPRAILDSPYDPAASPFGWLDTDGVAGADSQTTTGNNVDAYVDTFGFFPADGTATQPRPNAGAGLNFDFAFDPTQAPSTYANAATTNLFYVNNVLHDVHAKYGFTEVGGNFQVKNYSGQGQGNDPVFAVESFGSDSGYLDNAFMYTPPDGESPTMAMFLWDLTNPLRSGGFDAEVIVHEFGHGVSNRLTGGPANANALDSIQSGGMGEGWSDWWSLMFTQGQPTPTQNTVQSVGNYVLGYPQDGPGIRQYPYSYNMAVNPHTLGNYNNNPEVHAAGEIWAAALWDLNILLVQKHGYEPNLSLGYQGAGSAGNVLAMQLVTDGLKLQPVNPSFTQGRDAILLADQALTGGANQFEIWSAFARRGFGVNAQDFGADSVNVIEDFSLPDVLFVQLNAVNATENTALSNVNLGTFFDPAGAAPLNLYSATVDWGDGSPATVATLAQSGPNSFNILGSHTYREGGAFAITVNVVRPGTSGSNSRTAAIVDLPMSSTNGAPLAGTEGVPLAAALGGFSDALDPDVHAPTDYTVVINWGDGSPPTPGTVVAGAGFNVFTVRGTHSYLNAGAYTVTTTITSPGGGTATTTTPVVMTNFAIAAQFVPISPLEGTNFFGVIARFQARPTAVVSDFAAMVDWGDGTNPKPGLIRRDLVTGDYTISGSNLYPREGVYPMTVTLTDRGTPVLPVLTGNATVTDATISTQAVQFSRVEGQVFNGVVARFVDTNIYGVLSDYAATIQWGDGTPPTAATFRDAGDRTIEVLGTHQYAAYAANAANTFNVVVTVQAGSTSKQVVASTARVTDAPITLTPAPALNLTEGVPFAGTLATFVDANPVGTAADFVATLTWGDGVTEAATLVPAGPATYRVQGTHAFHYGTYPIEITVASSRPFGLAASTTATTAQVGDATLAVVPLGPITAVEGREAEFVVAQFVDANPGARPNDNAAVITWGDGTGTSLGTVRLDAATGRYLVSARHTYGLGNFSASTRITGQGGAVVVATTTVLVPNAPLTVVANQLTGLYEGPFRGVVGSFVDPNPLSAAGNFTASVVWSDDVTTRGLISPDGAGGFRVTTDRVLAPGSLSFRLVVRDLAAGVDFTAPGQGHVVVGDAPISALQAAGPFALIEGQTLGATLATFLDTNPNGTPTDWVATIVWGDGTQSVGTITRGAGGVLNVAGNHAFPVGSYRPAITVTSKLTAANTATVSTDVAVSNAALTVRPLPIAAVQGTPFAGPIAQLLDANPNQAPETYPLSINWGDGTPLVPAILVPRENGRFDVMPREPHRFQGIGQFVVKLTYSDGVAPAATIDLPATVSNAPITGTFVAFTPIERTPYDGVVARFRDALPGVPVGAYAATIDFGDGTTGAGIVAADPTVPGGLVVRPATPKTYLRPGPVAVGVTLHDGEGGSAVAFGTVTVADRIVPVAGRLVAADDRGPSSTDGITNVRTPTFRGTAEIGDVVTLFARRNDLPAATPIGKATAGADGSWAITTGPLLDGVYALFASAADSAGRPSSGLLPIAASDAGNTLVVDTAAPRVTGVSLSPRDGRVLITLQDDRTGFTDAALGLVGNYSLGLPGRNGAIAPIRLAMGGVSAGGATSPRTVTLRTPGALARGAYRLGISGTGLTDLAGNAIDGGVYTPPVPIRPGLAYVAQVVATSTGGAGPFVPPTSTIARPARIARTVRRS